MHPIKMSNSQTQEIQLTNLVERYKKQLRDRQTEVNTILSRYKADADFLSHHMDTLTTLQISLGFTHLDPLLSSPKGIEEKITDMEMAIESIENKMHLLDASRSVNIKKIEKQMEKIETNIEKEMRNISDLQTQRVNTECTDRQWKGWEKGNGKGKYKGKGKGKGKGKDKGKGKGKGKGTHRNGIIGNASLIHRGIRKYRL